MRFADKYIPIFLGAMFLLQGCGDSMPYVTDKPASDCMMLDISIPVTGTKASDDGLNEFHIDSLHLFFYTQDGHDDDTSVYIYDVPIEESFDFSTRLRIPLPEDALSAGGLFGTDNDKCIVYAVANVEDRLLMPMTITGLKSVTVDSSFDYTGIQDSFAMDGLSTLSLDRDTRSVSGTIILERAAAKLTLAVDVPESIEVEQEIVNPTDGSVMKIAVTYFPRPENMHVWIANGVRESELNTMPKAADSGRMYSNTIYASEGNGSSFTYNPGLPKYRYIQDVPFYSYPAKWDPASPEGNCFMTLEIPWFFTDSSGETRNVATYYRLSVQPSANRIERNTHYDMRVTIGRLGSTSVQEPVDMTFDWNYNLQWNIQTLPTDIKEIRYLLLNNNRYSSSLDAYSFEMENENQISIPFNTSHPVEIESVELSWRDFRENKDRTATLSSGGDYPYSDCSGYSPLSHFAGVEIDHLNSTLNLRRDMVHIAWQTSGPVIMDETAINAYTMRIRLRHRDAIQGDPSSHATVIVTQIPAIHISTQLTAAGTRFINNQNTTYEVNTGSWIKPSYSYYGFLSTSNSWNSYTSDKRRFWLGSYHDSDTYVRNKNTYILSISKFTADDNYIIADPRTRDIDNLNEPGIAASSTATWSMNDNTKSRLEHYYPADRDASKTRFIAPMFRVASQWGVTYQISRIGAERRCASYQEDGRPAGRWRLPTAAEIEYISRLSNRKYIPYLFGSEGESANYWCASGGIDVDNDTDNPSVSVVETTDNERRSVRCVYDEWFWASDTLVSKNTFKWGDRPRSTTGN